jgi:hypothetical protein
VSSIPPDDVPVEHPFYPYHREMGLLMNYTATAAYVSSYGDSTTAVNVLQKAVALQNTFAYMEPENFYIPLQQCLGAALIKQADDAFKRWHAYQARADHSSDTEESLEQFDVVAMQVTRLLKNAIKVYDEDLVNHPHNGWALKGKQHTCSIIVEKPLPLD